MIREFTDESALRALEMAPGTGRGDDARRYLKLRLQGYAHEEISVTYGGLANLPDGILARRRPELLPARVVAEEVAAREIPPRGGEPE